MKEPLEDLVRRVDQDRWLSGRFAPAPVRRHLNALYAFNYEIAHIAETVTEPGLGAIRFQWWADALATLAEGGAPPAHPVIAALGEAIKAANLPSASFEAMIAARQLDLQSTPFESWADLEAYLDATAGALMAMAAQICAPSLASDPVRDNFFRAAGRAWGYTGLVRALPFWRAQKRTFFPKKLRDHLRISDAVLFSGLDPDHAAASAARATLDRARGALRDVQRYSPAAPKEIFPAIGYMALTDGYIRAALSAPDPMKDLFKSSLLARQVKLVGAAATGSL